MRDFLFFFLFNAKFSVCSETSITFILINFSCGWIFVIPLERPIFTLQVCGLRCGELLTTSLRHESYRVNQTNVLRVIVVSLIYALQCRRVVSLPLARCTRESCAVSIDLDRTFQSWESIPKWKWRKCSFWDGKPILLPIKISLKVARKFSNFLTSIPALSYGRPHMIVFSSEI